MIYKRKTISEKLDIDEDFLFIESIILESKIDKSTFVIPPNFPIESHFISQTIIPASILLEFALQSAAFKILIRQNLTCTPIIGEVKFKIYSKTYFEENLSLINNSTIAKEFNNGVVINSEIINSKNNEKVFTGKFSYSYKI